MSFFQNVFAQEYQGYFNTGNDRQYSLTFKIAANQNTQDFTYSWNHDPFDFSFYNTIKINYAWDEEFRNWSSLEINISGLNSSEVTAYEVVSSLNEDATFASMFEARVSKNGIKNHVLIVAKQNRPKRIVKMYISNTSAERILRFNKKAPVGEIMSFFSRDTIDNRFTFPLSLAHLIELDPEDEFDAYIISEAGFNPTSPKADWELLRGRASGIYDFKKQTLDGSGRVVEKIEYPAGALVGDISRKTIYTFTSTNIEPDKIFQIPHVLINDDLITLS